MNLKICVLLIAISGMLPIWGQSIIKQVVNVDVEVKSPARYTLHEAIDVAIESLRSIGTPLTVKNLHKELRRMAAAHDVVLPGEGLRSWDRRQSDRNFEKLLAKKINIIMQESTGIAEPEVANFASRTNYVDAYVAYKVSMIDDEIRATYAKKLGGLNQYKRDMKNEAIAKWKAVFGSAERNPLRVK